MQATKTDDKKPGKGKYQSNTDTKDQTRKPQGTNQEHGEHMRIGELAWEHSRHRPAVRGKTDKPTCEEHEGATQHWP